MPADRPAVHVDGVVQRYRRGGDDVLLRLPDFTLAPAEHAVITGPSGSGKTTLLHLLAGLLVATEGRVELDGRPLGALPEAARDRFRAQRVGYVFQDFHLLDGYSALDNVVLGLGLAGVHAGERRSRASEALAAVGLRERETHHPNRLSTGERQRVAIARAVAHEPAVLLADEPTAHLDRRRAARALELLVERATALGATLVVATHDPLVIDAFERRIEVLA